MTAQRIASLLAGATEVLYGLHLGDRVVAVSHECDYPVEVVAKPRVTRSRINSQAASQQIDDEVKRLLGAGAPLYEIDVARLAALSPDLIVTQAQCDVCAVRYADVLTMTRSHPAFRHTRVVPTNPQSFEEILADIRRIGQAAGCAEVAQQYAESLAARVSRIRKVTSALPTSRRPKVACIEWIEPLMLAGNWGPEVIEIAGGSHALTTAGRHSPYVDWEVVAGYNPQVILIVPCGFDLMRTVTEAQRLKTLPGWSRTAAAQKGQIYALDGNAYFNRAGPRIVETIEILAHLLHPDLFEAPLVAAERQQAWRKLSLG